MYGSQSFDQHLMMLVKDDVIDFRVAMAAANNPSDFDLKINMLGTDGASSALPQQGYGRRHVSNIRQMTPCSIALLLARSTC